MSEVYSQICDICKKEITHDGTFVHLHIKKKRNPGQQDIGNGGLDVCEACYTINTIQVAMKKVNLA